MKWIALFTTLTLCIMASGTSQLEADQGQAMPQGIKVHGRWTIDVRNADGTLVSHHEFNNALTSVGALTTSWVLGRVKTPGGWRIALAGSDPTPSPCGEVACWLTEETDRAAAGPGWFKNIAVTRSASTLVLTGSATATVNGTIAKVTTEMMMCESDVAPVDCRGAAANQHSSFTSAVLATPVALVAGQVVTVTVVISFS